MTILEKKVREEMANPNIEGVEGDFPNTLWACVGLAILTHIHTEEMTYAEMMALARAESPIREVIKELKSPDRYYDESLPDAVLRAIARLSA